MVEERNRNLPRRRSVRLPHYDYASPGAYFVTLCAHERRMTFGEISDAEMQENDAGKIVRACWNALPEHFPHIMADASVVMPNHVHGIVSLVDALGESKRAQHAAPLRKTDSARGRTVPGSLGAIIRSFKSACTKTINEKMGTSEVKREPVWQRNYYERVIRNEEELDRIRRYILFNPTRWASDWENPAAAKTRAEHDNEMDEILGSDYPED